MTGHIGEFKAAVPTALLRFLHTLPSTRLRLRAGFDYSCASGTRIRSDRASPRSGRHNSSFSSLPAGFQSKIEPECRGHDSLTKHVLRIVLNARMPQQLQIFLFETSFAVMLAWFAM